MEIKNKAIIKDQKGIVSIMVSIVMMIVLTLLVVGLSQLGVSELQNSTKRQNSVAAYYLAESGVNAVLNAASYDLQSILNSNHVNSSTCLNYTTNIPCITVNTSPNQYKFNVSNGDSKVMDFISTTLNMKSFTVTWSPTSSNNSGNSGCPDANAINNSFSSVSSWTCSFPVLMINFATNLNGFNTSNIFSEGSNSTDKVGIYTMYLVPTSANASTPFNGTLSETGNLIAAPCSSSQCSITISPTNSLYTHNYFRATSIYGSMNLVVSAIDNNQTIIKANQIDINSTGVSGGVLQRIDMRLAKQTANTSTTYSSSNFLSQAPDYALWSSNDVCKSFGGNSSLIDYSSCSGAP